MSRIALVTGGSRGIGAAISTALQATGYTVAATYAGNDEKAAAFTAETGIKTYKWDVSDYDACAAGIAAVEADLGLIDILVNNAGITRDNILMRMKEDEWGDVIDTNLNALYRVSKACLRGMTKARWGRIVNITSVVGSMGNMGQANYAAAKAGVEGFSRAMAREVASRNVTVNSIAPGFIATDMTEALSDEQKDVLRKQIPLQRLGAPEDIANIVGFLASDAGAYITGETIHVNGGMYMS